MLVVVVGITIALSRRIMNEVIDAEIVGTRGRSDAPGMSQLITIPAVEWQSFLERFGRRHRGWLATVHGIERGIPVTCAASVRLDSLALERRDREHVVRLTFANRVSLCTPRPRTVRVQRTPERAELSLEIETAEGAFVRLAFRATAMPEELDGLAPGELNTDLH